MYVGRPSLLDGPHGVGSVLELRWRASQRVCVGADSWPLLGLLRQASDALQRNADAHSQQSLLAHESRVKQDLVAALLKLIQREKGLSHTVRRHTPGQDRKGGTPPE
jgi:hypothetical protein